MKFKPAKYNCKSDTLMASAFHHSFLSSAEVFFFIDTHKDENFGILSVYPNQGQSEQGGIASTTGGDHQAARGTTAARLRKWRAEMLICRNAINQK